MLVQLNNDDNDDDDIRSYRIRCVVALSVVYLHNVPLVWLEPVTLRKCCTPIAYRTRYSVDTARWRPPRQDANRRQARQAQHSVANLALPVRYTVTLLERLRLRLEMERMFGAEGQQANELPPLRQPLAKEERYLGEALR